jgi:hypothetical protein
MAFFFAVLGKTSNQKTLRGLNGNAKNNFAMHNFCKILYIPESFHEM